MQTRWTITCGVQCWSLPQA